jgi:hypothetical protein
VTAARKQLFALLATAVAGLGTMLMIDTVVRQLVYPAPDVRVPSPPPQPLVEVPLHSGGRELSAWWQPPSRPGAPVVLMLHGNGENLETMRRAGLFAEFARLGAGVLAIDYPGYGRSEGIPGEQANVEAAESAWTWLAAHASDGTAVSYTAGPKVVAGWSLGAAVATPLAARRRGEVDGLILMSGWNRLVDVAGLHFPHWIVAAALPERYDSAAAASNVTCPSLAIHGERDDLIPAALGRQLFAALPEPKRWVEVRGAGHNDLLGRPETWQEVEAFLQRLGARSAG